MTEDEIKRREAEQALQEAALELKQLQELVQEARIHEELNRTAEPPLCSFCGKGINQVRRMIEGRQGYICDSCIKACGALIQPPTA